MTGFRAAALASGALILAGCGSSAHSASTGGSSAAAASSSASASSASASAAPGCRPVAAPAARSSGHLRAPTQTLDPAKRWRLTVQTNCGSFTVALDLHAAPHAAASMVALARSGFFNRTVFHRIVPGFIIQGGDPTATGSGGPGYTTVDPPPTGTHYTRGLVAMAKTQSEPRGTAGSQFYVVTAPDAGLPPDYALLGRVTAGLDTVARIGALGDPNSGGAGTPTAVVEIRTVVVGT